MFSQSNPSGGVNCHTEPYSFSAAKPMLVIACRKSVQLTSPPWEGLEGVGKREVKTLYARRGRVKTGNGGFEKEGGSSGTGGVASLESGG